MKYFLLAIVLLGAECRRSSVYHDRYKSTNEDLREILYEYDRQFGHSTVVEWLKKTNEDGREWNEKIAYLDWNYETDITDANSKKLSDATVESSGWTREVAKKALQLYKQYKHLSNDTDFYDSVRQLRLLAKDSTPIHKEDVRKMTEISAELQGIYANATVTMDGKVLQMEPGIQKIMSKSRNPDELERVWIGWRDATGPKMRPLYPQLVDMMNVGATDNHYADAGAVWRDEQFDETPQLKALCGALWEEVRPLYEQLHAYVRRKLIQQYSSKLYISPTGAIPAHLFGNMWAQEWDNIFDIVEPFPGVKEPDLDKALKKKYDVDGLFKMAENFYTSLGLPEMTSDFWAHSMMRRPTGRSVQCHASAFDFYNDRDFRIKMCTEVDMSYVETIHHEMGHIEYFMAYKDQPNVYRHGANCAFHEAIGDTIALSVRTRKHLQVIDLAKETDKRSVTQENEADINYLMRRALYKIAFLPFGYMIDKWRWDVFSGDITPEDYNQEWWEMRLNYQGIKAPVPRNKNQFDPGAKFHIPANSPYICYFISFISQFQFYEALCKKSGHTGPLHRCDYYQSRAAGDKLKAMLELGSSQPWPEAMKTLTGQREVLVDSMKLYFKPLMDWLEHENRDETIGWTDTINWEYV